MKKLTKKVCILLAALTFAALMAGCGGKKDKKELQYSVVNLGGTEITLGKTTIKELKDAGFLIAKDKNLTTQLSESAQMPARTYDVGIYLGKDGKQYACIQCLNDKEEAIPYVDSIVNEVIVYYAETRDPYIAPYYYDSVLINGLDFKGLTYEEAMAKLGDAAEKPSETKYPGGEIASVSFNIGDCYAILSFDMNTGLTTQMEIEMFHSKF